MKYCKECLQPDTRPNIRFNEYGICPACEYWSSTESIDWDERERELQEICEFGRANRSGGYDCLIGVSGGKDSTRQALYVKNVLKMNPLLVCCSYPPDQQTERGAANIENLISLGFDLIFVGPSPQVWKQCMRRGFFEFGNWGRSTELVLFSSVPRLAIAYQIPLIFWGENPALTLGELGSQSKNHDGNRMKFSNTLAGGDASWLCSEKITSRDIIPYYYPSDEEMKRAGLRITYLGYFWKIWSKRENGILASLYGLDVRSESPQETGDLLGVDSLDEDWVALNQMIKYRKFGFGKVTEIVCEEIRFGRMTRAQGIEFVTKYDGKCSDTYINSFCQYLDISLSEFWRVVDSYTNKELFEQDASGSWQLKCTVGG